EAALLDEAHAERALPLHESRSGQKRSALDERAERSAAAEQPWGLDTWHLLLAFPSAARVFPAAASRRSSSRLPPRLGGQLNFCARSLHDRPVGTQQETTRRSGKGGQGKVRRDFRCIRLSHQGHRAYGILEGDRLREVAGDPFQGWEATAKSHALAAV